MALMHIPLSKINEEHLMALIANGANESRCIEYKREMYGNADKDYSELLADVSSFANTGGGDIVIGIDANQGIPTAITPIQLEVDSVILRLEQIVRGGLQPRIANFSIQDVPIEWRGIVLILRVPRSFNAPHRIIRHNSNRFWARSSVGKYEPDVNELRVIFNATPQLAERIRNFRLERIAKITADLAPVQLMSRTTLILHIVPLSAFDSNSSLPLSEIKTDYRAFSPIRSVYASNALINFDGVLKTSNADQRATSQRSYVQIYRNGIIEAADSSLVAEGTGALIISNLDDIIIVEVMKILKQLSDFAIEPPYALLVSLTGASNAQINFARINSAWGPDLGNKFDREQYHFDEVIFETIPSDNADCADVIRPILDQIANSGGRAKSPVFNEEGHYIPIVC